MGILRMHFRVRVSTLKKSWKKPVSDLSLSEADPIISYPGTDITAGGKYATDTRLG